MKRTVGVMAAGDVTALWAETEKGLFRGTEDSLVTQELPLDPRSSGPCDTKKRGSTVWPILEIFVDVLLTVSKEFIRYNRALRREESSFTKLTGTSSTAAPVQSSLFSHRNSLRIQLKADV